MRKKYERYREEECLSILRDYYSSGMSKKACCRKYGISSLKVLKYWLTKYESHQKLISLFSQTEDSGMANRNKESYKEENALLKQRIKDLEKALAFSKLETETRDLLIDKAEFYFNIPIRKKSGAKQ